MWIQCNELAFYRPWAKQLLVICCCITIPSSLVGYKSLYYLTISVSQDSGHSLAGFSGSGSPQAAFRASSGLQSSLGSTREESASELTHVVVGRTEFLTGCWTGLCSGWNGGRQRYQVLISGICVCYLKIKKKLGLPRWRSGWESACQCRGHGFEPLSGKIPHAAERLGPWAPIAEPACLEPVLRNKRGRDSERPAHRDEEWPPLAANGESTGTETKTQHSHKYKNK